MKIIEAKREIDTGFLYHVISFFSPQSNEYKRHFSELIEVAFYRPELLEEQQKTAACLSSLDKLITAFTEKLESLKVYKKGLMQSLFPAEGEAVPRLRFPEFRDSGEWGRNTISSLLIKASTPVEVKPNQMYQEIGIRSHGKGIFHKEPIRGEELGSKRVFWVEANSFVVNIVFAWEQAVATTSNKEKGMIASHRFPMYKARAKKCDVNFIKHFFLTKKGKELLGIASPGGAGRNKTLGQTDFNNITILTPEDVGEQKKISDTLTAFDELIAAQTKQIEVLKEHKLGLMQGLFPVAEDSD